MRQCEYATAVMFKARESLESIYPDLVEHATFNFNSDDVMTFLGRKLKSRFLGDLGSDMKRRPEGIRVEKNGKRYTAINPLSLECISCFKALLDGGNNLNGFSNKTIRVKLLPNLELMD